MTINSYKASQYGVSGMKSERPAVGRIDRLAKPLACGRNGKAIVVLKK